MTGKALAQKLVAVCVYLIVLYFIAKETGKNRSLSSSLKTPEYIKVKPVQITSTTQNSASKPSADKQIIKSFGTFLKDTPAVEEKSKLFRAVRPALRRKLPSAFPSNDFNSKEWVTYRTFLCNIGTQGKCGSCWAWATSGMLADRFSLLSAGKIKVQLSPAKMIICNSIFNDKSGSDPQKAWNELQANIKAGTTGPNNSCSGNDLYDAMNELYTFGTTSEECVPYKTNTYDIGRGSASQNIPKCWNVMGPEFDTCYDKTDAARIYRADDAYALTNNEEDIMQEIYKYGSVAGGMIVYQGFVSGYDGKTIYMGPKKDSSGNIMEKKEGGHAIRIVGWGEEDRIPYWWIANSWSENWGINGYFKMKRMMPECTLEKNIVAVKPEFPGESVWDPTLDIIHKLDTDMRNFTGHLLDADTLYYMSAMQKIKDGKLKGDLDELVTPEELPDNGNLKKFWIADLLGLNFPKGELEPKVDRPNKVFIPLAIGGVAFIMLRE